MVLSVRSVPKLVLDFEELLEALFDFPELPEDFLLDFLLDFLVEVIFQPNAEPAAMI